MATLGGMKTRIGDELGRSDLSSQISLAVSSAILFYKSERFWFNEVRNSFSTIVGTERYNEDNAAVTTIFLNMLYDDSATLTQNNTPFPLKKITNAEMDALSNAGQTQGVPDCYSLYANFIQLYPVPNQVWTVHFSYVTNIDLEIDDAETPEWSDDQIEELIRLHAKVDIFENVTRDFSQADRMRLREAELLRVIRRRTALWVGTGRVVAEYL